jgi:hypothetical protein
MQPNTRLASATTSVWIPAAISSTAESIAGKRLPWRQPSSNRIGRALADLRPAEVDAAHAALRENGTKVRTRARHRARASRTFREHDDAAALGRLVGERGELRASRELLLASPGAARSACLAIAERDRAGLVEQQHVDVAAASTARPDVAITLARSMRSDARQPIADSRPPIVVGIRHTSSATSTVIVTGAARLRDSTL